MRYIVFGVTFLFFNCGIRAQQIDVDSIAFADSLPVEIIYQKSLQGSQINLGRNQFLSFPGSFDDPSRLLMKFPGISTQNDQANFIIYHGMPSHYTKWMVYGTDIINPNHLGNAGTISDRNSRASGGVNSFSGQILGNFTFNAQPGMGGDLLTHAGSANMKPRTPFENKLFFNISAIGLEAGIERKLNESGTSNLMVNYRYSFTGLLGQMGVDFGGEVIGFQDVFAKLELDKTLGGKLSLFGMYGSSYNDHAAQDSVEFYKDGLDIRYDAKIGVFGANHVSDSGKFVNSIVYSSRLDERVSTKPVGFLPELNVGNLRSRFEESKLSLHSQYKPSNHFTLGIKASNFIYNPDAILDEELSIIDRLSYVDFYPYLDFDIISQDKLEAKAKLAAYYETAFNEFSFLPALSVRYNLTNRLDFIFNYNLTSQMQAPELYQVSGGNILSGKVLKRSKGHHFRLGISKSDFSVTGFYHALFDLAEPNIFVIDAFPVPDVWFTDLSNIDILPNWNVYNNGSANIYGISTNYDKEFSKGLYFSANATILKSKNKTVTLEDSPNAIPYDYGTLVNVRLQKKFEISKFKYLNVSTAFHYRGGMRESEIDLNRSKLLGRTIYQGAQVDPNGFVELPINKLDPYHRLDLRISYVKKKSKNNKYKSVISMDIQNLYGRENDAFHYYDPVKDRVELQKQLGMLPVISYRLEF